MTTLKSALKEGAWLTPMEYALEWMTLQHAEKTFSIPVATWRRWLREGRLGYSRLGGRILIRRAEVEDWLATNFRPATGATAGRRERRSRSVSGLGVLDPTSILAALLAPDGNGATRNPT